MFGRTNKQNGKASVIETGSNSTGQYRIWSDGTIEQWGSSPLTASAGYARVDFPHAFSNTDFILIACLQYKGPNGPTMAVSVETVDVSTAYVYGRKATGAVLSVDTSSKWYAIGK